MGVIFNFSTNTMHAKFVKVFLDSAVFGIELFLSFQHFSSFKNV